MYNNSNQYNPQAYATAYPNYAYGNQYYMGYGQTQGGYVAETIQPVPPGEDYGQGNWNYLNRTNLPAVSQSQNTITTPNKSASSKDENKGIEERKHHKGELIKQRDEYERRVTVLRRELDLLRKQKQELVSEGALERDHILKENAKLQVEIQNKLKDAFNFIEILSGIIGESTKSSKEELPKERESQRSSDKTSNEKYNYIHYDPEVHWCRICDAFPKSAKDFLMHLHSKDHKKLMQEENIESPWHKLPREPEFPFYEGAPKRRLPIKGLQFIISSTAWYCRLCDTWIGDLHCASHHLKSLTHSQNYTNFVEQNPHWEIEWLKDREKALERTRHTKSSESEDENSKKKKKHRRSPLNLLNKEKKKKKRSKKRKRHSSDTSSSSSSSESSSDDDKDDKSKSIRVAMRNKIKAQLLTEDVDSKWEALGRLVEERKRKESSQPAELNKDPEQEDSLISQWMTVKEPQDKDKLMLENLKDRMKKKQDAERARFVEMEQKRREKEKYEQEQREREEQEAKELEEQRRREQEESQKLKEKDREQVRFKTKDKYRKRHSPSQSPEHRRSRSPSVERKRNRYSSERHRKYSENGRRSRSRSITPENKYRRRSDRAYSKDKKPPPPPSYKKLPFIGRMPLFKNKRPDDNKVEKEIKKEDYEPQRQTRFQPGNLAKAFIPQPSVVCFPKLSTYPPISAPPPAPVISEPPAPPKISAPPKAPPPPKINSDPEPELKKEGKQKEKLETFEDNMVYDDLDPNDGFQFEYSMYQPPPYDYTNDDIAAGAENTLSHSLPLQPPPLPPDDPNDDLAMLGISSDDLAAQNF